MTVIVDLRHLALRRLARVAHGKLIGNPGHAQISLKLDAKGAGAGQAEGSVGLE